MAADASTAQEAGGFDWFQFWAIYLIIGYIFHAIQIKIQQLKYGVDTLSAAGAPPIRGEINWERVIIHVVMGATFPLTLCRLIYRYAKLRSLRAKERELEESINQGKAFLAKAEEMKRKSQRILQMFDEFSDDMDVIEGWISDSPSLAQLKANSDSSQLPPRFLRAEFKISESPRETQPERFGPQRNSESEVLLEGEAQTGDGVVVSYSVLVDETAPVPQSCQTE